MNSQVSFLLALLLIAGLPACHQPPKRRLLLGKDFISQVITRMMHAMGHNVTNPPLVARFLPTPKGEEFAKNHES